MAEDSDRQAMGTRSPRWTQPPAWARTNKPLTTVRPVNLIIRSRALEC